jgi:HD-like signal output (HDOD) protein
LLFSVERERFGFDYAQVGGELMRAWNLPASLESAIRFHTMPARADEFEFEAAIIHFASVVTETREWARDSEAWAECADPIAWQLTNLSVEAIEPLLEEADVQVAATMELILPEFREAS